MISLWMRNWQLINSHTASLDLTCVSNFLMGARVTAYWINRDRQRVSGLAERSKGGKEAESSIAKRTKNKCLDACIEIRMFAIETLYHSIGYKVCCYECLLQLKLTEKARRSFCCYDAVEAALRLAVRRRYFYFYPGRYQWVSSNLCHSIKVNVSNSIKLYAYIYRSLLCNIMLL